MLIAEELFLLLRRDDGKPESATAQRGYGLAAAVITDLVVAERITLSEDKDPRMTVLVPGPVGQPALDAAMVRLEQRDGKKLSSLVPERYPVRDPEPERRIRERLRTVLLGGTPTPADASLLCILQGLEMAPKVLEVEKGTLGRRELKKRIEEVSSDVVAGDAVAKAVVAMNTAIMTAVIIPTVVSSGGS
jgi:hypothetical protein